MDADIAAGDRGPSPDRGSTAFVVLGLVFAAGRAFQVLGRAPFTNIDSSGYLEIRWWGALRPPTIPVVYWIVGRDLDAIVVLQLVVGVGAWLFAAYTFWRSISSGAVRLGFLLAFLMLGLTPQLAFFDTNVASESLSVSAAVILLALTYRLFLRTTWAALALAGAAFVPWVFSRQANAIVALLLAAPLLVLLVRRREERRIWGVALAFVIVLGFVANMQGQNPVHQASAVMRLVCVRVLPDADAYSWWVDHGMPREAASFADPDQLTCVRAMRSDESMVEWLSGPALRTYASYVVSRPGYLFRALSERETLVALTAGPLGRVSEARESPSDPRAVLPSFVVRSIWPTNAAVAATVGLLTAVGAAAVALQAVRTRSLDRRSAFALVVVALVPLHALIVWVGLPAPFQRQMLQAALQLRVGLVLLAAFAVDAWITARSAGPPDEPRAGVDEPSAPL